jgi:hypothetical protein
MARSPSLLRDAGGVVVWFAVIPEVQVSFVVATLLFAAICAAATLRR